MTEDADNAPPRRSSDAPMDLRSERESFLRSFIKRGAEITEELLGENDKLRGQVELLESENTRLRTQLASDDAMRDFIKRIDALESEKRRLLAATHELRVVSDSDASRYEEIESELNDLANLYIAAYQLHASFSIRRVLRHVQDMLGQLMGAYGFAIYIVEGDGKRAEVIAHEHLDLSTLEPIILGDGILGTALLSGVAKIPDDIVSGTVADPFAILPLLVGDRVVGVISIVTMLEQKSHWATVDAELFKLIGQHAGSALIAANLYSSVDGPIEALHDVRENLNQRPPSVAPIAERD